MAFDWLTAFAAIGGSVTGGIITGVYSLKTTDRSFYNQRRHTEELEERTISGLLQAIHDEIETVMDRYEEEMGAQVDTLKDGEPLDVIYPLVSDFFTVYNSNGFLIGRIYDNDLRKQIIKTYTLAKGIVDSFRMNNDLVGRFEHAKKIYQETRQEIHLQQANAYQEDLIEYAKNLKKSHKELKTEVNNLLRMLRKNGVLSEKHA